MSPIDDASPKGLGLNPQRQRQRQFTRLKKAALAAVSAALSCALAGGYAAPASARAVEPPPREDSKDRPVIFIHGVQPGAYLDFPPLGAYCNEMWDTTKKEFRKQGWTGPLITWGYYKANRGCDVNMDGTLNTSLDDVAETLRKYISKEFGTKGQPVDEPTSWLTPWAA